MPSSVCLEWVRTPEPSMEEVEYDLWGSKGEAGRLTRRRTRFASLHFGKGTCKRRADGKGNKWGNTWALRVILSEFDGIYRRVLHHDARRRKCVLQKPIYLSRVFTASTVLSNGMAEIRWALNVYYKCCWGTFFINLHHTQLVRRIVGSFWLLLLHSAKALRQLSQVNINARGTFLCSKHCCVVC